jgi:site-specific DNA-methyltransferase (cytosine-N4-specific)
MDTLLKMPDNFLDCVITSPPYWQLRDYGYDGQWGLEPTFQHYLENLWSMMDEIYRVLKPSGTCWINLGDTYGTQSGNMRNPIESKESNYAGEGVSIVQPKSIHKCLLLIPHRFAIGCIDRGWIMRNDCIWAKRNGMPESVTDRFSKKHEYFFFMVKSEKYFFDLDAIRDKAITNENRPDGVVRNRLYDYDSKMNNHDLNPKATTKIPKEQSEMFGSPRARQHRNTNINGNMTENGLTRTTAGLSMKTAEEKQNPNGKNPGSVSDFWDVPTKPSSSKHYASYNDSLLVKPVLAGCPEGGIIYDPFMGTGSTAEVALRSNRNFIGSEMSFEYCKIAERRLEPFLIQQKLF